MGNPNYKLWENIRSLDTLDINWSNYMATLKEDKVPMGKANKMIKYRFKLECSICRKEFPSDIPKAKICYTCSTKLKNKSPRDWGIKIK